MALWSTILSLSQGSDEDGAEKPWTNVVTPRVSVLPTNGHSPLVCSVSLNKSLHTLQSLWTTVVIP